MLTPNFVLYFVVLWCGFHGIAGQDYPTLGGLSSISSEDQRELLPRLMFSFNELRKKYANQFNLSLRRIVSGQEQTVAGTKYDLILEVLSATNQVQQCEADVYEKLWEDFFRLKLKCPEGRYEIQATLPQYLTELPETPELPVRVPVPARPAIQPTVAVHPVYPQVTTARPAIASAHPTYPHGQAVYQQYVPVQPTAAPVYSVYPQVTTVRPAIASAHSAFAQGQTVYQQYVPVQPTAAPVYSVYPQITTVRPAIAFAHSTYPQGQPIYQQYADVEHTTTIRSAPRQLAQEEGFYTLSSDELFQFYGKMIYFMKELAARENINLSFVQILSGSRQQTSSGPRHVLGVILHSSFDNQDKQCVADIIESLPEGHIIFRLTCSEPYLNTVAVLPPQN